MKTLLKHSTLTFIAILLLSYSYAQVSFTAKTSNTSVKTGDRFKIQFSANTDLSNFKAPKLNNFKVLSGPNQSTQMSWVNGKTSSTISYTYILMAIKEGRFTIGPAVAVANGKAIKSNSLKITVGKGVAVQQKNQKQNKAKQTVNISDDMYIKCFVSKRKVYKGEQIIATYKLYSRVTIAQASQTNDIQFDGFWKQDIDLGQISLNEQEIVGGYRWSFGTLKKVVLFPQRSGNLVLDPMEYQVVIQKRVKGRGQGLWGQMFQQVENVEYSIKSKPIKITVLPHPANSPTNFTNAVGKLDMKVDVSTHEIKANEAINIKVKVSGKGNLPLIDIPTLSFPSDFETYDPKINNNVKTAASGVSGSKEFDYLVIPRHAGQFKLEPIVFTYFDPSTKNYKTITSDPIEINVLKADGSSAENVVFTPSKEDIKVLGNDIRYIHTNAIKFSNANESFYGSWKFYFLLFLSPLLFILTYIFRNKIRIANSDVVGMRKKKASKVASKFLKSAKQSLEANDTTAFYEDISKALFGYISDKLHLPIAELNQHNIKEKLITINVSAQTSKELLDTIELCDMARFAPVTISEQDVFSKAEAIINQINEEVK